MWAFKECEPKLLLFKNVTNASEIRERIMKASFPCAAINPRYVCISIFNFMFDEEYKFMTARYWTPFKY
jgi:hypothetical protein